MYDTVIDYTDNSVSLVIKKEYEDDTVFAKLGTENDVEMFTDIAQEFILPVSFMEDDNATANIDFTVISKQANDVGHYRVVVRRSERVRFVLTILFLTMATLTCTITLHLQK